MPTRLGDIINVIGTSMGINIPRETPQVPLTPIEETGKEFIPIKPRNIYELAQQIGVTIPELPKDIAEAISKVPKREEKEWIARFRKQHPEVAPLLEQRFATESVLSKLLGYAEKYPTTATQAKAIYNILTAPPETIGYITKVERSLFGKKEKKEPITMRPGPETMQKEFPKIIRSPELETSIQRLLGKVTEKAVTKIPTKEIIKTEELKYPEPPWITGYRGETVKEKAIESTKKYNENVKSLIDNSKEYLNSLRSPEVSQALSLELISPLTYDVARQIYDMTGGRIDLNTFYNTINDLTMKNREYLNNANSILNELFNIKIDLLNEIRNLVS